jgi:hypothetical protein
MNSLDVTKAKRVVVTALTAYTIFVLVRLLHFDGDPTRFVCAGTPASNPAETPPGLFVHTNGPSYDGQFFYRLALDPANLDENAYGITFDDAPYRQMRIGYAVSAWAISLGMDPFVPMAMILVNLGWLVALAWAGIRRSLGAGNPAVIGLLPLFWPGMLVSLGRNLSEIQSATLLVLVFTCIPKRPGLAATAACCAVLTRETTLLPLACMGLACVGQSLSTKSIKPVWNHLWLALPALCFAGWQLFLFLHHGEWPVASVESGSRAVALPPFSGLIQFFAAGLPFHSAVGADGDSFVGIGYRLFSWASLMLSLFLMVWLSIKLRPGKTALIQSAAFYGTALLFVAQTSHNWALGPSAFLRLANEMMVYGLFLIVGAPRLGKSWIVITLVIAWLCTVGYAIMMP